MNIDNALMIIGPVVMVINVITMFLCLRPKCGIFFTIAVYVVYAVAVHILLVLTGTLDTPFMKVSGVLFLPVILLLFQGMAFQKVFAFFLPHQITALLTFITEALVGITIGYESPYALTMFLSLSLLLLGIHLTLVLRFGRRLPERMFVYGRRGEWVLYSFGAVFSFALTVAVDWTAAGAGLYFGFMLFFLWSGGILCFTIVNTNEKATQTYQAETLLLQINAMREQTDAEKKHRQDMEILRHDMRHEMGIIMELFRTGKAAEAETVYADWQNSLSGAVPAVLCAEPVLNAVFSRFERKAKDKNIRLYVHSNIPDTLPIDTIGFSVIASNALENALTATDNVPEQDRRVIHVKLIQSGSQSDMRIGMEVTNPCAAPVEFDGRGLPVTHKAGHGIGVRSIAAFAEDNGYLLNFSYTEKKFTVRLVMGLEFNGDQGTDKWY